MKARIALLLMVFAIAAMAGIPHTIQYQGKLTDTTGIGENDTLDISFRVFNVETGGDSLWAMTIADVPIVHGLFDVALGPIDLPFDEQYWLEIVVEGYTLSPRVQLTSSPYAFRAAVADSFTSGDPPWEQDTMVAHWDSIRGVPSGIADGDDIIGLQDTMVAHWDSIRGVPSDIADGDDIIGLQDTMVAHWDSIRGVPSGIADGDDIIGLQDTMVAHWDSIRGVPDLEDGDWTVSGSNVYSAVSGNVGIGTTIPTEKLCVTGNIRASGYITTDTISSPLDTLYIPKKVWMEELITDSIEARSDVVKIRDALFIRDSLYFDGEWRKDWPVSPTKYSVGDFAQGGVVFWVDETGQHGLVCAKQDQNGGSGIQWYNGTYTNTEALGAGVYSGAMNTMLIIANQGSSSNDYAAGICANYTVTESGVTYGDWYLPSREELYLMYQNNDTIDSTATANGGICFVPLVYYWSSLETHQYSAWALCLSNGHPYNLLQKNNTCLVRAVRRF